MGSAAWAICGCVEPAANTDALVINPRRVTEPDGVRSSPPDDDTAEFSPSLEKDSPLIMNLLRSTNPSRVDDVPGPGQQIAAACEQ
jgi:hypothetical protein